MYLQFTIVFILVNCLLYASSVPSETYPYGCVECQKMGGTYCNVSINDQFCAVTEAYCTSVPAQHVITSCTGAPTVCADHNHDCSGCTSSPLNCKMCITTQDFCVPAGGLTPCYGTQSTQCSTTAVTSAMACIGYKNCTNCANANCYWSPINGPLSTVGCVSVSSTYTYACNSNVAICAARGGTFDTRCDCTADPNCGVCFGQSDTYTNYFCSDQSTASACQSNIYSDCNDPKIICPILIDPNNPYDTVCQCTQNPLCTVCITSTTNEFTAPELQCVSQNYIPPRTCQNTTTNCNDKLITCNKMLTCSDCQTAGCLWCDTGDVSSSPTCQPPSNMCPNNTFASTTCNTCSSKTDCASCSSGGCQWCYSGENGKSTCLSTCSPANKQQTITDCSKQDPCSQKTCSTCLTTKNCTMCEGVPTFGGRNPGFYCTSLSNCGKAPDCGVWFTCVADVVTSCSITDACPTYKDCLSCVASSTNPTAPCSWCNNDGVESCGFGCAPGLTVPTCAVYGPTTTTGWPVYTPVPTPGGGTGAPGSTAGPGGNPPGTTPSGTITPGTPGGNTPSGGTGNTPAGTPGGTGNTPAGTPGGTGNTPGGSGNTPGGTGNTPGGTGNTPGGTGNTPGGTGNTPGSAKAPGTGVIKCFDWVLFGVIVIVGAILVN